MCVTVSDVACNCSVEAASCSANAATSSASRCTVEMVAPIPSSMRLKLFSKNPSSSDAPAGARTARCPRSASPITLRAWRIRSTSVVGIRFRAIATATRITVSSTGAGENAGSPPYSTRWSWVAPRYASAAASTSKSPTVRPGSNV